ncbi:hypothetical protein JHK87_041402 [Glycine soja]|nr:hypothetical protein JHK87_041402 [Glycine soja]
MEGGLWNKELLLKFVVLAVAVVNTLQRNGERHVCRVLFEHMSTCCVHWSDPTLAGPILRMHFHFCDASVLIAGDGGTERTAGPNLNLRGYEVIDDAKAKLEAVCPGVVSCADILTFAAPDSKYLATAPFKVQFGKSMIKMSNIGVKTGSLGGHTIGRTARQFYADRIYSSNGGDWRSSLVLFAAASNFVAYERDKPSAIAFLRKIPPLIASGSG